MRPADRIALALACAVVLGAAFWWRTQPDKVTELAPDAPPASGAQTSTPAPADSGTAPVVMARIAVDPASLPADVATLLARAGAGDARAACELGVRFSRCSGASFYSDQMIEEARAREAKQQAEGKIEQANRSAQFLLAATQIRQQCDGIPEAVHRRAFDLLRQAALAGHPEAVLRYARGEVLNLDGRQLFAFLRTPRFETWRREALPLLETQLQAGHPEAVLLMLETRSTGNFLSWITPPDAVQDQAYQRLAQRLFGDDPALRRLARSPRMTEAQRSQADALAEQWHRDRFGGQQLELERQLAALVDPLATDEQFSWPRPANVRPPCADQAGDAPP